VDELDPPQRRRAAPDVADDEPSHLRPDQLRHVAVGPQLDVVSEPARLLVRVGVAAEPGEQRHVVDDGTVGVGQVDVLGDAQPEHARSQHVLHRLAEPEVSRERHRCDQLGQAHVRSGD
jgi:hypothetical protein